MNNKIKQLAEQAEKYADDNFKGQPTYSEAYDSKFAELILLEVYDILSAYRNKVIFDDGFEYNCEHPIQAIQKHFGEKR
jgi:hypothetical protein